MSLSEHTIQVVKSTAPVLLSHGEAVTRRFYQEMLSKHPELRNIFNETNQKTGRQQTALANALYAYASYIDQPEVLTATIQRIAHKHVSLNIRPEHYPIVGKHLLEALSYVLGDGATEEVLSAWKEAYEFLANVFIEVEEGIYREKEMAKGGWRETRRFFVTKKVPQSNLITSFYFEPEDGLPIPGYYPGQYIGIYLHPKGSNFRCIRQYSLSDAPNGKNYRISVKREGEGETSGVISHYLHDKIQEGDIVELCPPVGDFYLDPSLDTPIFLLSGGVGQTPMLSMLNTLVKKGHQQPIIFVHSATNSQVHAFDDHVKTIAKAHENIKEVLFYDAPTENCTGHHFTGKTDLEQIRTSIDLPNAHYFFCGPLGYMKMVHNTLKGWGVTPDRIHYEVFGPHKEDL